MNAIYIKLLENTSYVAVFYFGSMLNYGKYAMRLLLGESKGEAVGVGHHEVACCGRGGLYEERVPRHIFLPFAVAYVRYHDASYAGGGTIIDMSCHRA